MSEYIVQPHIPGVYNVHKFEDGSDIPSTTYKVVMGKKPNCNCPAGTYRGWCKHIDYVRTYRKREVLEKDELMVAFDDGK